MRVAKMKCEHSVQDMLDFVTKCEREGWKVISIMKESATYGTLGFTRYETHVPNY